MTATLLESRVELINNGSRTYHGRNAIGLAVKFDFGFFQYSDAVFMREPRLTGLVFRTPALKPAMRTP